MNIYTLTPKANLREGVIATVEGKTEKGYTYFPNDIITGKYVIDRRSYDSDYTEQSNVDGKVTFIKTKKMNAMKVEELMANIDAFNSNISEKWIAESVVGKGLPYNGKVAFIENDKLVLVTSERVAEVPNDVMIMFNTDEDGKYFNVYYCPNSKLESLYENASDVL